MSDEQKLIDACEKSTFQKKRFSYLTPVLTRYDTVSRLTMANGGSHTDGNSMNPGNMGASDRLLKQNIVSIGTHPISIGIYLFDYKPEFRDAYGHGRQFGVMADEVEKVMPEAVSVHPDGYKMVNYAMLGISRNLH
ncbi:MAG: tail fiber domain-containing protein [Candidatus Contendobacter sp.]|nr:tail fiber domain-containing protein [Candidatus Contendobacter sp.]MDG4556941.1 tail fiber domain-containing protein [Candidatus Contendobacter sp.]